MDDIKETNQKYNIYQNPIVKKLKEIDKRIPLPESMEKRKENSTFTKIKKNPTNTTFIPKKNIIKSKIKKQNSNIQNNIIINNNTNIINNNNINIINNNIINTDDTNSLDRELNRSLSHLNLLPISKSEYNNNIIMNQKNTGNIYIKNKRASLKNFANTNINNLKNKVHMMTYNNNTINNNNNIFRNYQIYNISDKKTDKDNNKNLNKKENNAILNVEEILMIEEKLSSLINCLYNNNTCAEESFECINFYFTTKFCKNINIYFSKEITSNIIKKALNLKIFSYILCYDISLHDEIFTQYISIFREIFSNIHNILILISKFFCNKTAKHYSNIWVKKLHNLTYKYDQKLKTENTIFKEINIISNNLIQKIIPSLLQRYIKPIINDIFSKLESLTQNELQKIYKEKIYVNMNINGSIIGSSTYFQKNKNYLNYSNDTKNVFFLNKKPSRRYTLVLDLDETLIHFKGNPNDDSSGLLQFRPYLSEFLFEVSKFYELIVFTAAVKDYADPIIDAIEAKGIKFDYRLYRVHTIVINNDFVKDLSRLGRDISRTIIVDNMEQNYKLQPENGITIRPFWGKDANDMALVDLLNVLVEIAKNNMDVRDGIRIFKEDIISRVTSNIFRRVQI
jgi:Dullard-like phosphatase family protein